MRQFRKRIKRKNIFIVVDNYFCFVQQIFYSIAFNDDLKSYYDTIGKNDKLIEIFDQQLYNAVCRINYRLAQFICAK